MAGFLDAVRFLPVSAGLVDFVVSQAITGYQTPASAGAVNGTVYRYRAENADLSQWEIGFGAYTTGTTTLARTTILYSSNGGAAVNFTVPPNVGIVLTAEDMRDIIATTVTTPIVVGGTDASSTLTLESTSGAGTTDMIVFKTASQTEAARFDTAGRLIIADGGTATLITGAQNQQIQNYGTGLASGGVTLGMFNTSAASAAHIDFYRSKGATIGTATVVATDDLLGEIYFWGAQQTGTFATQNIAAKIQAAVDGVVTSGAGADMPGRLSFFTTPDGSGTPVEAMRIDNNGSIIIPGGASQANSSGNDPVFQSNGIALDGVRWMLAGWIAGNVNPQLDFAKSRGAAVGTHTIVVSGDLLGLLDFTGSDGVAFQDAANIRGHVDGTPGVGSMPGRLQFHTTPTGATSSTERMRIAAAGNIYVQGAATTAATTPLGIINNASTPANELLRSTSSLIYKTNVTDVPQSRLDLVQMIRPIEFNSIASADDQGLRMIGFAAEEVAKIDDRLVTWRIDEATGVRQPDGVNYISVLLLQIAALMVRVKALEGKAV